MFRATKQALDAAARLADKLPSRRHKLQDDDHVPVKSRAVVIAGRSYPSLRQAAAAHGISNHLLAKWIEEGKARYDE